MATEFVIGIDEVGRGALAGPVVVAAAVMPASLKFASITSKLKLGKLRDSKKLTPQWRERWFGYFKNHPKINYALARVYPRQIEKLNISGAANLAAGRAIKRLSNTFRLSPARPQCSRLRGGRVACRIFLDGGLFLGSKKRQIAKREAQSVRTITRGDEKIMAIAIASIIAKVSRDSYMARLAKKYPRYGLEIHKGYGTKKHLAAIKRFGASEAHRKTFCR